MLGALNGSSEWLTPVSYHTGQWKAHSPRHVPPASAAESWHLSGSWLEQQRQPVPRARGQEQHSQGEAQPGYVHSSCRELFLGKAAYLNIFKCHLCTSSLKHYLTCLVKWKAPNPIFENWWDNRCLSSKQERGRCVRVLKPDLENQTSYGDLISSLSQMDVMFFQQVFCLRTAPIHFEMKQEVFLASSFWSSQSAWKLMIPL